MSDVEKDAVRQAVSEAYIQRLEREESRKASTKKSSSSCKPAYSERLGYSKEELAVLPAEADLGLGCGNPTAMAGLKPGEVVVDLGAGGGVDCFLAGKQVGPEGRVIGVDMTPKMLSKARVNAEKVGAKNVEFRLGEIENLPVADGTVDVILSNCVINLSSDKARVFREAFRILKPGGRLHVADVVATDPLPEALRKNRQLVCGCMGQCAEVAEVEQMLAAAGFTGISISVSEKSRKYIAGWAPGTGIEEYVASAQINAVKPGGSGRLGTPEHPRPRISRRVRQPSGRA